MKIYPDCTIIISPNRTENFISLDSKDYQLKYLNDNIETNKGGNSNLFLLMDLQEENEFVIKLCKVNLLKTSNNNNRLLRFKREIDALKKAKDNKLNKVIDILSEGEVHCKSTHNGENFKFLYFITEKGVCDLSDYILDGNLIDNTSSKVQICKELIDSLEQLHSLGIYHRDIKPDNILFFSDGSWKICDLGLITYRGEDLSMIDKSYNMIGPKGWLSPESTNRYYTFGKSTEFTFDSNIDELSDIFQLGKVFWFIFQTNIPIGRIRRKDFRIEDDGIYGILIWMLSHNKSKRPNIKLLSAEFQRIISKKYV
ncbi:MAG: protein kinase family protein [Ignavibacteria bacterium]